jgi:hypothetical protein
LRYDGFFGDPMVIARLPATFFFVAAIASVAFETRAANPDDIKRLLETKSCENCDLSEANLRDQNLFGAKLAGANLRDADFRGATLTEADLRGARLGGSHLEGVDLVLANLNPLPNTASGESNATSLELSYLNGANLKYAEMKGVRLLATQLADASFFGTNLEGAVFEPVTLPNIESISDAVNLKLLTYDQRPLAMLSLRKAFKEAGFQSQQRQITYALMHKKRLDAGPIEGSVRYVLFELMSEWGLSPLRPLWLLILLMIPFAIIYAGAIVRPSASAALWRVWDKDRIRQDAGTAAPVRLDRMNSDIYGDALFFSFISAFSVGWHEINIGTWIGRLNPNEYTLRATGWLRSLSGFQSLVSIFLFALAFLCYFGDPFE